MNKLKHAQNTLKFLNLVSKMSFFEERKLCPACKSKNHTTIYSCSFQQSPIKTYLASYYSQRIDFRYLNGAKYILDRCDNCELIYQREIPNRFLMKKLYEDWINTDTIAKTYRDRSQTRALLDCEANKAQEVMMLIDYFKVDPVKLYFLDAGMGWGSWCLMTKAFGINVFGIELSRQLIELGRSNGITMIAWDELTDKTFDFINTEQFFEHVGDPLQTLCCLAKSLKTNGIIKISVPDATDIDDKLKVIDWTPPVGSNNSLRIAHPLEHVNCFNRYSIIRMAKIAELQEVKMPIRLQYTYSTNWRSIRMILKNLLKPVYYNILQRGTYLFFRRTN